MIFLVIYDRARGALESITSYAPEQRLAAEDARLAVELDLHEKGLEREVVLLDAHDEAALHATHGRYFFTIKELVASATGIASAPPKLSKPPE